MLYRKKFPFLLLALLIAAVAATTTALRSQDPASQSRDARQARPDETEWPIVDYATPEPADPEKRAKRRARSKSYDKSRILGSAEVAGAAVNSDSIILTLPTLPATQSNAIVIGEVVAAQAYLSNDRTNVYSEFTLRLNEVLRNDGGATLAVGDFLEVEREGGRVRFPNGKVFWYVIERERMPRVGRQYVLFLKREDSAEVFHLLTGYELREGKVFPLDSHPKFNAYNGVEGKTFLNALRNEIANPSQMLSQ